MAHHHVHTRACTALKAASASVSQIRLIQINPLLFELESIMVENTLFCWCKSKLSPFGILT